MRTPEEQEALLDKVAEIVAAADESEDKFQRGQWAERHPELNDYSEKLKTLNGDDFDIMNESYNEFNNSYKDLGEDQYIEALKSNITKTFQRIWPEAPVEQVEEAVNQAAAETEGETQVEETNKDEAPVEETKVEVTEEPEEPEESEEDKFNKDLENEYKRHESFYKKLSR